MAQAREIAEAAAKAFGEYPHWRTSSHQEQGVRKLLYKALIDAKVEGVVDVAQNVLRTLRKAAT